MKGFFIKKAFFDGWDNLIGLVLFNLGYLALFLLLLFSSYIGEKSMALMIASWVLLLFVNAFYSGAVANAVYGYSCYKRNTWSDFKEGWSRYARHSLLYAFITLLLALIIFLVIPFYYTMGNAVSLVITVLLLWVVIIALLALPYYFALSSYLPGDRPMKTLKKCFIVLADNMGFSIMFLFYNIFCLALTVFTLGLIPGFAGMSLASHDAIKLIMLKYDYLEENPDTNRRHLSLDDILYEEREKIGPRSFKNMIFPWK